MLRRISQISRLSRPLCRAGPAVRPFSSSFETPVTDVRSGHAIDQEKLVRYLKAAGALTSPSEAITVMQFSNGQSNPTFILTDDKGYKLVVRKQPPGQLLPGAHAVDREYQVMVSLQGVVPVPKTRGYCDDPSILGTPFYFYDFVEGRFFKDPALTGLACSGERRRIYENMIDNLARIHSVDVDKCGLGAFGKRVTPGSNQQPYVLRQIKTWSKMYRATATELIEDMEVLMAELAGALPKFAEQESVLVHGDFRIDNMLFCNESPDVMATLDWELSTLGDNMSDFSYFCMPYELSRDNPFYKGLKGLDLEVLGIPSRREAFKIYTERLRFHSNGNVRTMTEDELDYYSAFSFFRSAAILQGVYKRSLGGNAAASTAHKGLQGAKDTAKIGRQMLERYKSSFGTGSAALLSTYEEQNKNPIAASKIRERSFSPDDIYAGRHYPVMVDSMVSERAKDILQSVSDFFYTRILPAESEIMKAAYEPSSPGAQWTVHPLVESLKGEAKALGLWNLFLPLDTDKGKYGARLTNLEYATIAEMTGRSIIAPEVFNCAAPDTGNMEVLARYGTDEQKDKWLNPLLDGQIRSCFAMTEPAVASSDATNMQATIRRDGDELVLNGTKWWISGALDPRCSICIFMGRTDGDLTDVPKHRRHSMVLVPMDSPGLEIIRPMRVMGYDDAPHGHAEMVFKDVRVPFSNIIVGEGTGFEIAQGRLGPGRIHHCMRLVGMAERAIELMAKRASSRTAFGKLLSQQGSVLEDIAKSRVELDCTRLLCLNAAHKMDLFGNKVAQSDIGAIKIAAPNMAKRVVDRAIQVHGAMGLSQDTPLAHFWCWARILQFADGPDQVHMAALGKKEVQRHQADAKKSPH